MAACLLLPAGAQCCSNMVVSIWSTCLQQCVLGCNEQGQQLPPEAPRDLPVGQLQLSEVVEMLQVCGGVLLLCAVFRARVLSSSTVVQSASEQSQACCAVCQPAGSRALV